MKKLCVLCNVRSATRLADSDSIQFQDGLPVCDECFEVEDLDEQEERIV